jgi:hypothetical protein
LDLGLERGFTGKQNDAGNENRGGPVVIPFEPIWPKRQTNNGQFEEKVWKKRLAGTEIRKLQRGRRCLGGVVDA